MPQDTAIFSPLAWLVAAQFGLYALGWGLFSLVLRSERAAVAHWGGFMLMFGLGFTLAAMRGEERAWVPYVGANLAYVLGYVALRRGLVLFMGAPSQDRELALTVAGLCLLLLAVGPGADGAPWRVLITYGAGIWMLARAVQGVAAASRAEFGVWTTRLAALPAYALILGFGARVVRQLSDWSQPLEMQAVGGINQALLFAYLAGAAMFNFSFMAVVTLRLVTKLREQARHDPLTGLPNRRTLEYDLQREWQRLHAQGDAFAVLALDLDHFKRINDVHGHLAGDAVLEQTAGRLRAAVRAGDTVARTGGEEFVVLMPHASLDAARSTAQRLIEAVRREPFDLGGPRVPLTVSVGVTLARSGDAELQQVMQRADEALYRAKADGRDRAVLAAA